MKNYKSTCVCVCVCERLPAHLEHVQNNKNKNEQKIRRTEFCDSKRGLSRHVASNCQEKQIIVNRQMRTSADNE